MENLNPKKVLGGYLLETRAAILAAARGRRQAGDFRRFVIFGRGRSGSTMIVRMLNSHPRISCEGEILRFRTLAPVTYIENTLATMDGPIRGFKLLSYQMQFYRDAATRDRIRNWFVDNDVTLFHIKRDNLFNHAISNIYAKRRKTYHSTDRKSGQHESIHVEPAELIAWMTGSQELLEFENAFLDGLNTTEIVYENDLEEEVARERKYREITAALGVEHREFEMPLKKVTPRSYRKLISNYDEVERALRNSRFARYLPA